MPTTLLLAHPDLKKLMAALLLLNMQMGVLGQTLDHIGKQY
jgi:hypothetical protein